MAELRIMPLGLQTPSPGHSPRHSVSKCSVAFLLRSVFAMSILFGFVAIKTMHTVTLASIGEDSTAHSKGEFSGDAPSRQDSRLTRLIQQQQETVQTLAMRVEQMESLYNAQHQRVEQMESANRAQQNDADTSAERVQKMGNIVMEDHQLLRSNEKVLRQFKSQFGHVAKQIDSLNKRVPPLPAKHIKIHFWDDSHASDDYSHDSPREDILVQEGWLNYNGNAEEETSTQPWFVLVDDPWEADLILWITVMSRHEKEIPPTHPIDHAHKVIVLDYADGWTIHMKLQEIRGNHTELAYFKRSFIIHGEKNTFRENVTNDMEIYPYAYSGAEAMMIPSGTRFASRDFLPIYLEDALIYGKVAKTGAANANTNSINSEEGDGYFKDPRYDNFLVPYRDRKWTLVNHIRYSTHKFNPNHERNRVFKWTQKFSQERAGDPMTKRDYDLLYSDDTPASDFTAYVGEIDSHCGGYCFGANYLRHLRDTKIVVTCNPSLWEGDFRLWEAFLSGALVFVDKMYILDFMPNPPIAGTHWVTYDPGNETDFMTKLAYYSDPANIAEAEAIAKRGYEFVLKHHMPVNRVHYILNHEKVRTGLMEHVRDPSKRAILRLPPLEGTSGGDRQQ